eukprot:2732897-Karenia_brevis.AAC.1
MRQGTGKLIPSTHELTFHTGNGIAKSSMVMPIWVEELKETTYPQEMGNSPDVLSIGLRCRSDARS